MTSCFDHTDSCCNDPRCFVLARCLAEILTDDPGGWLEGYYPQALLEGRADLPADLAHRSALFIADRLIAWVRSAQAPHPLDGIIDKRSRSLLVPSEGNGYDWAGLLPHGNRRRRR